MKTIAVIFGGKSTEHDVSVVTAISSVIKPLEASKKYNVEPIYIAKDGSWYWDKKFKDISLFQTGEINDFLRKAPKLQLQLGDGLTMVKSSQFAGRKQYKKVDIVFPAMHGTHGEDGELMGLLQMSNVAFVGCDMTSSAIAMDKILAKQVVLANNENIKVPKYEFLTSEEFSRQPSKYIKRISKSLKYPVFVKPAHLGSSIGITKVTSEQQLMNAIEVACHYDNRVIIEEAVSNLIEVTLPIIGNDELQPASLERPLVSTEDFFDFETKYLNGGKKGGKSSKTGKQGAQGYSQVPAELPEKMYQDAVNVGLEVYKAIGCSGIARVDMLIDSKTKQVYFNEINPLPGSLYLHNWNQSGVSAIELVTRLVDLAEDRWAKQQNKTVAFNTNYLKQF